MFTGFFWCENSDIEAMLGSPVLSIRGFLMRKFCKNQCIPGLLCHNWMELSQFSHLDRVVGVFALRSFCGTKFSNLKLQALHNFNVCINNRVPGNACCNEFCNLVCVLALIKGREVGPAFCTYQSQSRFFCFPHYWCNSCAPS